MLKLLAEKYLTETTYQSLMKNELILLEPIAESIGFPLVE